MYYRRRMGALKDWSDEEVDILQRHYATMPVPELMALLPERTLYSIRCYAKSHFDLSRRQRHGNALGISLNSSSRDWEFEKSRGIAANVSYTNWEALY